MVKVNNKQKYMDCMGTNVTVGKILGRGGEGVVYEVKEDPKLVLKIYHKFDVQRSKKISIMSSIKNDRLLKYTSWPVDVVKNENGKVMGLLMPRAQGKEIHKLYSPKSRQSDFENVGLSFLIHTAANIARAFAVVHENGHVIGDVNHGNILVSENGTIRLIDCDSFQINSKGSNFLCKVGVSTHQPPELQSRSLSNTVRTANHDNFGLAIIIFQMLFMGRHPFSGKFLGSGDMPIEKAIEQYRFAYGKHAKQRDMQQPPGTLPLDFYSKDIAELFEKAFSKSGTLKGYRPRAIEWIQALENVSKEMVSCSLNLAHRFAKHHKKCPWCEYEGKTGITLFTSIINSKINNGVFQLEVIWKKINNISPPNEEKLPKIDFNSYKPSYNIIELGDEFKRKKSKKYIGALFLGIFSLLFATNGALGVLPYIGILASFILGFNKQTNEHYNEIYQAYINLNKRLNFISDRWDKETSSGNFFAKLNELKDYKIKYEQIPSIRAIKLRQLERDQKRRQLNEYLDSFYIQSSDINSIGPSRKAVLQSYGIETARDINKYDILNVPGFGHSLTGNLIEWRRNLESKFIFDPKRGIPKKDIYELEKEIHSLKAELEGKLLKGEVELNYIKKSLLNRREVLKKEAVACINKLGVAYANLSYLKNSL